MKSLLPLTIGWRFYRARQSNGFIGFISFASTAGIALGVAVLILVLSAMNGFERELEQRLLGVVSHGELLSVNEPLHDWQSIAETAKDMPEIVATAPFIRMQGLVQKPGGFQGIELNGIEPEFEQKVSTLAEFMPAAAWNALAEPVNNIVLGRSLLDKLGLSVGDTLSMYTPDMSQSNKLSAAKSHRFIVAGVYDLGGEIESTQAYVSMSYLASVLKIPQGSATGLRITVNNVFSAPRITRDLGYAQSQYLHLNNWTRSQGHLYQDIQLVRMVMYLVLALVIAVACFNIVSTLVMAVRDKSAEIAILMTMGLKRGAVMAIFIMQGGLNGLLGCTIGAGIGVLLATNLSATASFVERTFGIQLLASDIYFIDFLPSELQQQDVILVVTMGLVMSLFATIYPAYKATKIAPASALAGR
ncbi:lipoprotein-releasing ABC transporter permease subunit LolE [Shewanella sp. 1_MG-2023]|uniref:lipoprotein-releasing ABC transporter permease subunit LolE n=1 Tax=unclassified Shewanella TaxID=196818 RepID=UPI000C82A942|nr:MULTISPECIES: lipoprotein-releasing ABC transporter permease subunit LolE [unclassified Shewanella]MDO6610805.1 lipoprotein-releasing ABC transporter permease subunit LolE [Shewanella sp. 7_MG-2023]MDO6770344.1 lipoprotein-releasing ABC transporter permease subunit LolE [Shewanella sp. 2_MG-2023]MDO6793485.1 lipoprotein-releasing ABC transporter permease subunit LolE [Shewanella sp. 1_MG-2023]PMG75941.1 cell division protein FtsX [Shewanella sp. 10N.286.51.B7]